MYLGIVRKLRGLANESGSSNVSKRLAASVVRPKPCFLQTRKFAI